MSLTNRPLDVVSEPDRPAREIRDEDAIEIAPEMVEKLRRLIARKAGDWFDASLISADGFAEEIVREISNNLTGEASQ